MKKINILSLSNNLRSKTMSLSNGFTIVEITIIVPIAMLAIGVFITAIVSMTGDVLSTRASNALAYTVQDALNRIEQDVNYSDAFLPVNNITLTSPQGYNDDTTNFHNADATNGTMLILKTFATTSNPLGSARNLVYNDGQPYQCSNSQINKNTPLTLNIVYFVKDNTLWRRIIAPTAYQTIGCSVPWQKPSCAPGYSTPSFCKAQDMRMVDNITSGGFSVKYYSTASPTTENTTASSSAQTDSARLAAIQTTNMVSVTITATTTVAGRDISQSGNVRAVSPNNRVSSVLNCPTGFIIVPGSGTYGTSDFCVMKYEAKIQGNDVGNQTYSSAFVPESRATGTPWVNISQINADTEAQTACTGCHLMTEAEWLTIAQNVLSVPSNWNGGVVGTSYIYTGHNDNVPANPIAANANDDDGYYQTGQTTGTQRRTLTLTNGEVIWDLAGNVCDWTSGTAQSPIVQPGGSGLSWREWKDVTTTGTLPVNPFPSNVTSAAGAWTAATNGIGQLYSNSDETVARGFIRGGWYSGGYAGVLTLNIGNAPGYSSGGIGFRAARN